MTYIPNNLKSELEMDLGLHGLPSVLSTDIANDMVVDMITWISNPEHYEEAARMLSDFLSRVFEEGWRRGHDEAHGLITPSTWQMPFNVEDAHAIAQQVTDEDPREIEDAREVPNYNMLDELGR